jgi:hypothetical protein
VLNAFITITILIIGYLVFVTFLVIITSRVAERHPRRCSGSSTDISLVLKASSIGWYELKEYFSKL